MPTKAKAVQNITPGTVLGDMLPYPESFKITVSSHLKLCLSMSVRVIVLCNLGYAWKHWPGATLYVNKIIKP